MSKLKSSKNKLKRGNETFFNENKITVDEECEKKGKRHNIMNEEFIYNIFIMSPSLCSVSTFAFSAYFLPNNNHCYANFYAPESSQGV